MKAVVLLSGGLDSATVLAMASKDEYSVTALSFRYGQKHSIELDKAAATAAAWNVRDHVVLQLDPEPFRASSLTGEGEVQNGNIQRTEIPSTYVPARNTVFLSLALALAESREADAVFIGVNALDYSGYPDCRPAFIKAFRNLAAVATKSAVQGNPVRIEAPLLHMTKAEIIRAGLDLGVDYSLTLSCYRPDSQGRSCGTCDSCLLRLKGFRENGETDPATYV
ncbi:7-cyano-7-deazaguanine synthase QueC [Candidatus Fermentibacteria bacterium]|nr:MAG: 7-cyano-7-deazaguanine synthase QueC [Candidatus Fermentibacteria bacterium]PIE52290.1 MAG: 7-cyano-7-deazaguanine synthase QueC [Candidatus Fermentibacteria bacterium]PIE52785.1 MAG: 7-cyano-7-deazaguanine synthase QueC [Candidatus Fermentibacteria bacterium]